MMDTQEELPSVKSQEAQAPDGPTIERYREDWQLVQDCVGGDRAKWQELLERHEATVYFAILHTLRARGKSPSEDTVRDLQSDVLTRLVQNDFRKLSRYSGRCKLSHWLKIVANNHTIDHLRHSRPTVSLSDDTEQSRAVKQSMVCRAPRADQQIHQQQRLTALRQMCADLPESDRQFIELHLHREMSFEDIAVEMNTTVGAIYARKNRIRKKLIEMARERGL